MKKKLVTGGIVGMVLLGGAMSAGALTNNTETPEVTTNSTASNEQKSSKEAEEAAKEEISGEVTKIEKDEDDGRVYYEVDILDEDGKNIEVEVDANTAEILKVDRDDDDRDEQSKNYNVTIDREEAVSIAENEAEGNLKEVKLDDGHYELEFRDGNIEYEIKVNGENGEIIDFEKDRDED
ncbi:PepSY domain-containing protein [Halobacillus campisalis]|uniref:PepSY domain-containing protein n=1 Tax=Halobacillus campisalis TaxID=435909 RepID=A0ABW2K5E6_9BACI|nr:PepSY domain-containing protein [Halobacillus campisalis]